MFRQLIVHFINEKEEQKEKRREENIRKYYEIRGALIKFYEDYDNAYGVVDIPAFKRADEMMRKVIKDDKDIEFYYNKLKQYNQVA